MGRCNILVLVCDSLFICEYYNFLWVIFDNLVYKMIIEFDVDIVLVLWLVVMKWGLGGYGFNFYGEWNV